MRTSSTSALFGGTLDISHPLPPVTGEGMLRRTRYQNGPLGIYIDAYEALPHEKGYFGEQTVKLYLHAVGVL